MNHIHHSHFNEENCLKEIQEGNSDAFRTLFLQYYERLCLFAYRYIKSRIIAEDLVQEVFVKMWERREELKDIRNLKPYLYQAVKNEALDFIEHQDMVYKKLSMLRITLNRSNTDQNTENLDHDKFESRIQNLIEVLPEKTRQIFKLCKMDGLSYEEIADILDISVKTVEYHISKTFEIIRVALKNEKNSLYK